MGICTLSEVLSFLNVENYYIIVNAGNNILKAKYAGGSILSITIAADGTYTTTTLCTALQSALNTAFSIATVTVTFSTTTNKYTISTGNASTVQIILSASTAALLLGFSENSSAATSITSNQVASSDPSGVISVIQDGVENWIEKVYTKRTFSLTTYSEQYDAINSRSRYFNYIGPNSPSGSYGGYGYGNYGSGSVRYGTESEGYLLTLKNYPITAITRVAVGTQDAMTIKNTNTYTTATISISTTGITLIKDGVSDITITFASYATLGLVVNAINALGNGWVAALASSDYTNYLSSELIKCYGRSCINNNNIYLTIPYEASSDFEVDTDRGQIYFPSRSFKGKFYLRVDYSAGYSSSDMPDSLAMAIKILIQAIWQKREETSFPLANYKLGELTVQMWKDNYGIPPECISILNGFKRILL